MKTEDKVIKKIIQSVESILKEKSEKIKRYESPDGCIVYMTPRYYESAELLTSSVLAQDLKNYLKGKIKLSLPEISFVNKKNLLILLTRENAPHKMIGEVMDLGVFSSLYKRGGFELTEQNINALIDNRYAFKTPEAMQSYRSNILYFMNDMKMGHVSVKSLSSGMAVNMERLLFNLSYLKFSSEETSTIHYFFEALELNPQKTSHINYKLLEFVKKSIDVKHWTEFKKYMEEPDNSTTVQNDLFSKDEKASYLLNINSSYLAHQHTVLSLGGSCNTMIEIISNTLFRKKDKLGLFSINILPTYKKQGLNKKDDQILFVSKDETPVNSQLVKSYISHLIELYVEELQKNSKVNNEFMDQAFNMVELTLALEENKKEHLQSHKR